MTTVKELQEYLDTWEDDVEVKGHIFLSLRSSIHKDYVWSIGDVVVDGLIENITDHVAAFDAERMKLDIC